MIVRRNGKPIIVGNCHGAIPPWGKSLDVGVDEFNYCPVSFEELKSIMATRPETPKPFEDIGPFKEYFWYKLQDKKPVDGIELLLWDGKVRLKGVSTNGILQMLNGTTYENAKNIRQWMYLPNPPMEK
jgi:hypothetical protein